MPFVIHIAVTAILIAFLFLVWELASRLIGWFINRLQKSSGQTYSGRPICILTPEQIAAIGETPAESIVGFMHGDGVSVECFTPNPPFEEFMHDLISTGAPLMPSFQEMAANQDHTDLYIIDQRTPDGIQGRFPREDIIGSFKIENGHIVAGSYWANERYLLFSEHGLLRLPASFEKYLVRVLLLSHQVDQATVERLIKTPPPRLTMQEAKPVAVPTVAQLTEIWRSIIVGRAKSWVLFRHGTCVISAQPQTDIRAQAIELMRVYGPVHIGSPSGDFSVAKLPEQPGWIVSYHNKDIHTYLAPEELTTKQRADVANDYFGVRKRDWDATEFEVVHGNTMRVNTTIGVIGRNKRDQDASELEVIHVEDNRSAA